MRTREPDPTRCPECNQKLGRLTHRHMKLAPVERGDKLVGGRRSRRVRKFKWVIA